MSPPSFVSPLPLPSRPCVHCLSPRTLSHRDAGYYSPQTPAIQHKDTTPRRPRRIIIASDRVLWAKDITKTHDGKTYQFQSLSLNLPKGAKIALLGANGCGKSTLLSVLAGQLSPDSGTVNLGKNTSLAFVSQELPDFLDKSQTTLSAVLNLAAEHTNSADVRAALRYAKAAEAENLDELAAAATEMDERAQAWEIESYLRTAMTRLELPAQVPVRELSGGQKRRIGIVAALISKPDILLLDEVTNHLSIEGIEFLEERLRQDPGLSVICISHDRYFVDAVCTTAIWELDGELYEYSPGYESFLREKARRIELEQKEMMDLAKAFRRELEWMRRQPKARATKAKSRIDDFQDLEKELKLRKSRLKERRQVRSLEGSTAWLGTEVLELHDVTLKRGEKLIVEGLSYTFQRGERIGVCGGNGVGKSSFLKMLMGQLPMEGKIRVGDTVVFGHYEQEGIDLSAPLSEASLALLKSKGEEIRVIDYVAELLAMHGDSSLDGKSLQSQGSGNDAEAQLNAKIEALSHSVALSSPSGRKTGKQNPLAKMTPVGILDHFGFKRQHQHTFVSKLSGGEKRRLQLMALLLKNPNFLILDEVSNDLDLNTLTMLEELLLDYSGVLVLCSHDRFMLDRLVDHLLIIEGDGMVSMVEGKFTDYLEAKREQEMKERREKKNDVTKAEKLAADREVGRQKQQSRRLSFKEKKEYSNLEQEIEECHERHEKLSVRLEREAPRASYGDLAEWTAELARIEAEIEAKTERWVELAEIAGD